MPTYQYTCRSCDVPLEVVQSFTDSTLTDCPSCGGSLRKVFSPVGVVFKGSGFYRTDSRGNSKLAHMAGYPDPPKDAGKDGKDGKAGDSSAAAGRTSGSGGSSGSSGNGSSSSGSGASDASSNGSGSKVKPASAAAK